jgi:carbon monoxide dehydrogenase subunit G
VKVSGTQIIPAAPEQAYAMLQDPAILAKAIPGCGGLEKTGEGDYKLKLKVVLASLGGDFEGRVRLTDPVPPTSFRMIVEGTGKMGFLKGEGVLKLGPIPEGTEVTYDGDAQIGGKMAAVGNRLIDATAKLLIKRFFQKINQFATGDFSEGDPVEG